MAYRLRFISGAASLEEWSFTHPVNCREYPAENPHLYAAGNCGITQTYV
jgi:hypothetical protein